MKKASSGLTLCALGIGLFSLFSSPTTGQVRDEYGSQVRDEYGEIYQTVARISYLSGEVSFSRGDDPEDWQPADRNVPMTFGDRIYTGGRSRIELQVEGGNLVRLGSRTDFAALNLTEDTKQFSMRSGVASIRIRRLSDYEIFEIDTPNAAVSFERPGEYRVDVDENGFTRVAVRRGGATVAAGGGQIPAYEGEAIEVEGIDEPRYDIVALERPDAWDQWVSQRDDRLARARSYRYVSADIVGADDLDEYGRWEEVRDYGWVWSPTVVAADWAPYRLGHWIWQDPWGWTWVSAEPWGWAPYHYGRWARISSRWYWIPVAPTVRYVTYSPALVAFVGGGPGWSASISFGGGGVVGWFPLGPRDPFSPWWGHRARERYPSAGRNVTYVNQSYLTVVNQNVFVSGRAVTGNTVRDPTVVNQVAAAPVLRGPIPVVPTKDSLRVAVRTDVTAAPRPPAAVVSRTVVVRTAPPPAPPTFQTKLPVISENRGAPIAPDAAAEISIEKRGRPKAVTDVRPVAAEPGRVTLSPRGEAPAKGTSERRAEPVTASRGRPMATSEEPVSAKPVTVSAPPSGVPAREPVLQQPIPAATAAPESQPERWRERRVVTAPPPEPRFQPVEKARPQVAPAPTEPPATFERRGEPTAAPAPSQPTFERRRDVPKAAPVVPQPNLERGRERPTPAPPQMREVEPEPRPPKAGEPQDRERQPVHRPTVTPKSENLKNKKDQKEKKVERGREAP